MKKQTETFEKTALSIAVALCLFVLIMAISQLANASGGKVNNPWQKLDADECAEWQIDEGKSCTPVASDQSGSIFICEVLVVCPDLEKDD